MFSADNQPLNQKKKDFRNKVGEFLPVYEHLRGLFKKNQWSMSSIQRLMLRFVEGFHLDIIWESEYRRNKVEIVNGIVENILKMKGLL